MTLLKFVVFCLVYLAGVLLIVELPAWQIVAAGWTFGIAGVVYESWWQDFRNKP